MMHLPKEKAAPERRRHLRSVTTTYMPDHDVVAAPFADGHIATVVSASISPIIVAPVSPIVVPIKIATFALTPAVGPYTDVELSERDRRFGRDSITSVSGGCR
jgi:hypothetical protein